MNLALCARCEFSVPLWLRTKNQESRAKSQGKSKNMLDIRFQTSDIEQGSGILNNGSWIWT